MDVIGTIFDIQRFSVHDGPGIRTLLFFKGCSLRCAWCSNPEGLTSKPQIKYNKMLCNGCGKCLVCPEKAITPDPDKGFVIDRTRCTVCGECAAVCPTKAKALCGEERTVEEMYDIVKRDRPFFKSSGGGVTLGGGDPLVQAEAACALLGRCKQEGLNTAIETAGFYDFSALKAAAPHCDTILFDIKAWDEQTHQRLTGGDRRRITSNLALLGELLDTLDPSPTLVVRIPLLPGVNFDVPQFRELAEFLLSVRNVSEVQILPFHNLGMPKYEQYGMDYTLADRLNATTEEVRPYLQVLLDAGLKASVMEW